MSTESVQLIFQIKAENQSVLGSLRQMMSGVNSELEKGGKLTATLTNQNGALVVSLKNAGNAAQGAAAGQKQHNDSMADGIVKGLLYSEVLMKVASFVKEATVESAKYAARTQQLNVVMDQLARVNGISVSSVRQTADSVKALGISTQESREVISRMIFAQLDLSKATDLARMSQNAAKVAGISSSEALQGIINGIVEQRVQILRTYGVQVSFEQALIRGAAALGKTREQLTDYERANIALNEVLSKGPRIAGAYEVSLSTAAGQMQSLTRYTDEARNALGQSFLPILQKIIGLLTDSTKSVSENADAYSRLAVHITSASLAIAAAKLTPGGPIPKVIAGLVVGGAAEYFGGTDAVEEQTKYTKSAIEKIQKDRKDLYKKYLDGKIVDSTAYVTEDQRLKDLQIQVENNFTEELARIYAERQDRILKKFPNKNGQYQDVKNFKAVVGGEDVAIPDQFDLGNNKKVTRQQVIAAVEERRRPLGEVDPNSLNITPNPAAQFDVALGQYTTKVKDALKASTAGLAAARAGLLSGEEKIEAERKAALDKLAEDFKEFNATFKSTLEKAKTIKDPEERQHLIESVRAAQGQYGTIARNINREFDMKRQKDERDNQVEAINQGKKVSDAESEIRNNRTQKANEERLKIARASQILPGSEQNEIEKSYRDSVTAARQRREESRAQSTADLEAAQKIFAATKNTKEFEASKNAIKIAELKAEGVLADNLAEADTNHQLAILALRRQQRAELIASAELARKGLADEFAMAHNRAKDAAARRVRVIQANASLSGGEVYGENAGLQERLDAARQEYKITKDGLQEQQRAARQVFIETGNKLELERAMAAIRHDSLAADYSLEKEILDIRTEKELQIADIRKQQDAELRNMLGSLYEDLGKKGRGAKFFFQDMLDNFKKQLFVNSGSIVLRGAIQKVGDIIPGQQQVDPVTGKPTGQLTPLGQVLKGTVLGVDPVKLAAAQQLGATKDNTEALRELTSVILGGPAGVGVAGAPGPQAAPSPKKGATGLGGILGGILGGLGGILQSGNGGLIIKNFAGSPLATPALLSDGNSGGVFAGSLPQILAQASSSTFSTSRPSILSSGYEPGGAGSPGSDPVFSPSDTPGPTYNAGPGISSRGGKSSTGRNVANGAIAAVAAIPAISSGIHQGGVKGISGSIAAALGAAASIPGPQQPYVAAAAALAGLVSMLAGPTRFQKWQKNLDNRLASKFHIPASISLSQDLAGNSVDFDYLGNIRTYRGGPSTNNTGNGMTVNISALDAQSFQSAGPMLAHSVRNMILEGHPLASTIQALPVGG